MTDERVVTARAHYGRTPESLLFSDATDAECRLYAALTTYDYGRSGQCYPGREIVAKQLGWGVRTIDRHFRALEARGAIERVRQGRGHPNLIILQADLVELPELAGQPMSRQSEAHESPSDAISPLTNEKNETSPRARNPHFDALVAVFGDATTRSAAGFYAKNARELAAAGATPEQIVVRGRRMRAKGGVWADATPAALVKHWDSLGVESRPAPGGLNDR